MKAAATLLSSYGTPSGRFLDYSCTLGFLEVTDLSTPINNFDKFTIGLINEGSGNGL